jgi:hypothetical protein
MKTKIAAFLMIPILSACVMGGPRFATPLQMYEGSALGDKQIATIMTYDRSVNPSNSLERLWLTRVVAVDGAPVKDLGWEVGKIQIKPGDHVLTMTCQVLGYPVRTSDVKVSLVAGRVWYPWANVPLLNGRPYSDGRCSSYIKTTVPTAGWSGEITPA